MTNRVNQNVNDIVANHIKQLTFALNQTAMVIVIDKDGKISTVNDYFCKVSTFSSAEIKECNYQLLFSDCHNSAFFADIWSTISVGMTWSGELCGRTKGDDLYWAKTIITPLLDEMNKPYQYVAIMKEITAEKNLEKWKVFANYDVLTKLPNRRKLNDLLPSYVHRAKLNEEKLAVAVLDIDQFKLVNDRYGHLVGDRLLIEVANRLTASFEEEEYVFRQGGDEFIVLFNEIFNLEQKLVQLLLPFYEPIFIDQIRLFVTISVGVSIFPDHSDNLEKVFDYADQAMFSSKRTIGNTFCFYNSPNKIPKCSLFF